MFRITLTGLLLLVFGFTSAQVMNVRKWRKTERDSLDNALLMVDEKMYLHALPIFESLLAQHPAEDFLKYSYARTALNRADKHPDAYKYLTEVYERNKKIPEINYELALACHYNNHFGEAEQYLNRFFLQKKLSPEARRDGEMLKKWIANAYVHYAKPTRARITNLGSAINSADDEYAPAISADESVLIYTYAGEKSKGGRQNAFMEEDMFSGIFMEDVFISYNNGKFSDAVSLDSLNTNGPDAALSLSADGSTLFLFKDEGDGHGDIYESRLVGETYTAPVKLRGEVNSYSWDGHCSLSPDGRTLYFSSERSGGKGGRDIYRASLSADSSWTNIVNLGDSVNSEFDDDAPFISADGVTLYFSSKGRNSMGGYDIYRAAMNETDSAFTEVEHLGYPINSTSDDIYFVMAANGKNGYYSSSRKGGEGMKDIYLVEPNFSSPSPAVMIVKGIATAEGIPVAANLHAVNQTNGKRYDAASNALTGKFLMALPVGHTYSLVATSGSYPEQTQRLDATKMTVYSEKTVGINFSARRDTTPVKPIAKATPTVPPEKDGFIPLTKLHEKSMRYMVKNGDVALPGLEFKVQVAALKNTLRYYLPHLSRLGRFEKLRLDDGLTRIMLGGSFKTLRKAFAFNKKVVRAGQKDAYVIAFYKGRRVQFEDLVKDGVFENP